MKVCLTRKFGAVLNGVDLSRLQVGDVIDLPAADANILIAEGWAVAISDERSAPAASQAEDRPKRNRKPRAR
jgi:hypothetical protein